MKTGLELKYDAKKPVDVIEPGEMWEAVATHTRDLNPVERHEKIERLVYVPDQDQRLMSPTMSRSEVRWDGERDLKIPHAAQLTAGKDEKDAIEIPMHLTDHAWAQLCTRISPAKGFKGVMDVTPGSLRFNMVNHFLQERAKNEKLGDRVQLFRTWEPEFAKVPILRGMVGHGYIRLDDHDILRALEQSGEVDEAVVRHFHVEENSSTFKLIFQNKTVELTGPNTGDALNYALEITNSEVGAGSVSVWGAVEILSCLNGMTRTDQFCRFIHTGDRDTKLRLIGEAVREAAQKADKLVDDIRASLDVRVNDPAGLIERHGKELGWSQEFAEKAKKAWDGAWGGTLFDVTQAVTSAAKDEESGRRRFELERDAGNILDAELVRARRAH
jgi:hypothetical protein